MTPIAQSAGLMQAVGDFGTFIIGTLTAHAGFFLTMLGISIIFTLIARKLK